MSARRAAATLRLGVASLAVGALIAVGAVLLGVRFRIPLITDRVRRMNRAFVNPKQMKTAGTSGSGAAVLHHVGRRSGKAYRTPIGANPVDGGFAVALTYGPNTDWLRNLEAAGEATLVVQGQEVVIDRPEIVPTATVRDAFSPVEQIGLRVLGIDECLMLHSAEPPD